MDPVENLLKVSINMLVVVIGGGIPGCHIFLHFLSAF